MNIGRDQINIEHFKGNFYTGTINPQNSTKKKDGIKSKSGSSESINEKHNKIMPQSTTSWTNGVSDQPAYLSENENRKRRTLKSGCDVLNQVNLKMLY